MAQATAYLVKHSDGGMLGPVSLSTLKDLLTSGHLGADAQVSTDRQTFVPITSLPELAGVVPQNKAGKAMVAAYSGFLEDHSFFRVFYRLTIAKETGRMLLQRGEAKKEIFLVNGAPVFIGSNLPEERIGEYLVEQKAISRQQLADALVIVHNFGNHLGNTLMGMKVITPHAFYEHLVGQLRQKLMSLVDWPTGRYDFYKGVLYDGPKLPVEINALEVLTEAMRTHLKDRKECEARLGPRLRRPLVHAEKPPIAVGRLGLTGLEMRLYESMNDMRTPEDLALEIAAADQGRTALALAYYLLELGLVESV